MFRRPIQTTIYLVALILIVFAILTLASKVWNDVRNLETAKTDNMQWTLSQLEVDYLNLRVEQERVIASPNQSLKKLRDRFDIFYSRVSTFRQSSIYGIVNNDPQTKEALGNIWKFLESSLVLVDGTDRTLVGQINTFSDQTKSIGNNVRTLSLMGVELVSSASDKQREDVSRTLFLIALLSIILIAAVLSLLWVFWRQYRRMKTHTNDTQIASSRLNAVVTSSLDAVIVIDRSAKILEFNSAAEQIFEYSKAEAVGGDLAEMIVPEHLRQAHNEGMQRYLDTGEKKVVGKGRVQLEARKKSGKIFPVELSISSAESHEGEVFVAFLRDISNRVARQEELTQARDDALAGEKAKAELLAVMSHEMRTPLNGMLGTLELMQDTHLSERQEQYLDIIDTSGKLLLHHVNDVLDISRLDSGKFETNLNKFDICKLMKQICDSQRSNAEAKANKLTSNFEAIEGQIVIGDDVRLRQILLNILGNSIKFTRNGQISVEAERMGNDFVEIRISDTGIGIHEADLEKIFEDFVTLDTSYGRTAVGTGLGLGITRRMIEAMDGSIGVESVKDEGSLFWIKLPLPEAQSDDVFENTSVALAQPAIPAQHILVVEDNRINRFVVREMLEKDGHSVFEANDGDEGVAICEHIKFDTILMDISMPRLDGVSATRAIRKSSGPSAKSPIIALTAHALPEEIIKFNEAGMNDTLIKPISRVLLRKALRLAVSTEEMAEIKVQDDPVQQPVDHTILNELQDALGGEKFTGLLNQFVDEAETELTWITSKKNAKVNNAKFVARVHKLAGSASLFGAGQLHSLLLQIETICKSDDDKALNNIVRQLDHVWEETKASLP